MDEVFRYEMENIEYERDMFDEEAMDYEQSIMDQMMDEELRLNVGCMNHEELMTIEEELIIEEELSKDEILMMNDIMYVFHLQEEYLDDMLSIMEEMENDEWEMRENEQTERERVLYASYNLYDFGPTREEEWRNMNQEWLLMSQEANPWKMDEDSNDWNMHKKLAMDEEKKKKYWITMNRKSIMNEEWRTIIDETMNGESLLDEVPMFTNDVEVTAYDLDMVDEEEVVGRDLIDEDSMDYEQSIMDEMMGLHQMAPVINQKPSAFKYTPLDQPKHEIRVVRLYPRRWLTDPTIICDITTVDLRTAPEYEALSYEWGFSCNQEYTIQLNQKTVAVRQNLWWALNDLRNTREPRYIWIDALCINQYDVQERNSQVSRMGDIYSQATRVVAWIGQDDNESRCGRAFLSELSSSSERYCLLDGVCQRKRHEEQWQALKSLCNRSYWSRLWIIQEVLLASDLCIQIGSLSFQWEELSEVFHYLRYTSTGSCSPGSKLSIVSSVPFRLEMRRKQHREAILANSTADLIPLLDLVDLFKDALCFDDRDKIFGLRSLSLSCCKDAVETDYSKEYENVIDTLLAHHDAEHQ